MADNDPDFVLQQLTKLQGVKDYVILNRVGVPIKYNVDMTEARAIKISGLVSQLVNASREFLAKRYPNGRDADDQDVTVMRLRTKKNEIIIAPDDNYTLVVLHNPNYVEPIIEKDVKDDAATDSKE